MQPGPRSQSAAEGRKLGGRRDPAVPLPNIGQDPCRRPGPTMRDASDGRRSVRRCFCAVRGIRASGHSWCPGRRKTRAVPGRIPMFSAHVLPGSVSHYRPSGPDLLFQVRALEVSKCIKFGVKRHFRGAGFLAVRLPPVILKHGSALFLKLRCGQRA